MPTKQNLPGRKPAGVAKVLGDLPARRRSPDVFVVEDPHGRIIGEIITRARAGIRVSLRDDKVLTKAPKKVREAFRPTRSGMFGAFTYANEPETIDAARRALELAFDESAANAPLTRDTATA